MLPIGKDRLTNLYTEEFLQEGLDAEINRARRYKHPLSLILLEPDIPEEARADRLYPSLKILARQAEASTRVMDVAIRWGHQILLLLPETPPDGALKVVEKVRNGYLEHPLLKNDLDIKFPIRIKASIKAFPDHGGDKDSLLVALREDMKVSEPTPEPSSS